MSASAGSAPGTVWRYGYIMPSSAHVASIYRLELAALNAAGQDQGDAPDELCVDKALRQFFWCEAPC
jgi:hypothetical protein